MNAIFLPITLFFAFAILIAPSIGLAQSLNSPLLGDNSRWSLDTSARVNHETETNSNAYTYALGLDIHKVFSSNKRDIGTLTFQPYVVKLKNVSAPPFFFDNGDDTQLNWRIANFNYSALSQGKLNIKIGHFLIPFGLELNEDTNGTLRQFTFSDRGIQADWGVSINGVYSKLEYEVALTQGSGNELLNTHNPYIFSGRLGTSSHKNLVGGLSFFYGDVLTENGVIERKKIGVDTSFYYYQWQFLFESSFGQTAGNDTINSFIEASWLESRERFKSYLQLGHQSLEVDQGKQNTTYWAIGLSWNHNNALELSAQYKRYTDTLGAEPDFSMQVRYRL
ncbi:MAG: hypothetical protein ABJH06_10105 [Paraglaciecola sp.]|uniref:hypothetical protein n=1 Tax=Paraglaciecola sp. TaxID=1920173 RepID=UPI00329A56FA